MTIDELIKRLEDCRALATLKGKSVVHFCLQDVPYIPVDRVLFENDSSGGSVVLLCPKEGDSNNAATE